MYRIFCESYQNFIKTFDKENSRLIVAEPLGLITDVQKYQEQEKEQTDLYKRLCDLIYFLSKNVDIFPRTKAFLWTLSSRNMKPKNYNVAKKEDLEEQAKFSEFIFEISILVLEYENFGNIDGIY